MIVPYLRIRWLMVLTILAIAAVLSACSDPPAPTLEPTAAVTAIPSPETTATAEPTAAVTAISSPETTATAEPTAAVTAIPSPETTATASPETARPTSVTVSSATVELDALGATAQLRAEVSDQGSSVMPGVTVTWTTSASSVAEVDAGGVVTAAGNGTATVTASAGSASGSTLVTVTQAVASVEVSPSAAELTAWGETVQFTAEALDANGHAVAGTVFSWKSDDVPVAEVDAAGVVTAAGNGTATVTASAGSASGSAVVTVTQAVASVEVSPSMTELTAWGETVQFTAEALDANGHAVAGTVFSWKSDDVPVAEVDAAGVVTAAGNGTATVTASAGSASGSAVVTVTQAVASVEVSPSMTELTAWGETVQFTAEALDANGHAVAGTVFSWKSDDVPVAEVDAGGVVTAAGNGAVTITASAGSASGSALITVTQTVASVEVSPAVAELTAWDETVQLRAEALDANGHAVAGAMFSWESADALVAAVGAAGVVTATGNGTATITASAGSASGSTLVTVTQAVASVKVSPSVAYLTAWGETVQLTAEAFDANGHRVIGAVFSWESAKALVAEVDTLGLVSGIGEGEATVTASAGAASGSAKVTVPATYILSGTVRDSRHNGPMLAGAVVRLENGKRESMVIGPDGRYRFPNVWGTVTVRASAGPTHVTETVEITVGEDRTLDFDLEHIGAPPYPGTVFISPRVIEPSDPTRLGNITYGGRGERIVWDARVHMWTTINAYLFDVRYAGQKLEFRVNPEFDSKEAAQAEVETYAHALGQMPAVLLPAVRDVDINAGKAVWSANEYLAVIHIHTEWESDYIEETFVHEAVHVTLDPSHKDSPGWRAAQAADGVFISTYAHENPDSEDVAESFLLWFAVRYQAERLTAAERTVILRTIPNRLAYFDEQGFDMSPYTQSEVQGPSGEIVTIQGTVTGPDNQPLEGIFLWAWAGSVDNSGNATTGEDGSFLIVVPDGSFTLDVYAGGERCIGWYGPGGFTTVWEDVTRIEVDGESVLDIVIRLPDHPDAFPRIC